MLKNGFRTIKHTTLGMFGGTILGMIICFMFGCKNKVKNKASRAVHAVGDLLEQILFMFK